MHWQNRLMLKTLHSIVIQSNALTKLFELLSKMTAFDAEIIKCIDDVIWCSLSDYETNKLLMSKMMLHLMLMSSNALTKLFDVRGVAFDRNIIKCIDKFVENVVRGGCIRCWNHQMHCRFCLMSETLHSTKIRSYALTNLFDVLSEMIVLQTS